MSNKDEEPPSEYELRRERIATSALSGVMGYATRWDTDADERAANARMAASIAVAYADALIAELDK